MDRQNFLDGLAGLLIIDMVLGHIVGFAGLTDSSWLRPLSFFMFWFYFKSGMFYRPKERMQIMMGGGKEVIDNICSL